MGRLTTLWMLDDFSPENGATLVIPGSHKPSFRENNQGAPETRGTPGTRQPIGQLSMPWAVK
jgi:hypothetical protein